MRAALWTVGVLLGAGGAALRAADAPTPTSPVVVMETSLGSIRIQLDGEKAPVTVRNFLAYVQKKHFDGTVFHRVLESFVIQGGGFDEKYQEKPTEKPIKNEARNGLHNERGTIAMARTSDPDSATCQFFINVVDNSSKLDPGGVSPDGYAVFGKVVKGLDVVDKIRMTAVGQKTVKARGPDGELLEAEFSNVPQVAVVIRTVRVEAAGTAEKVKTE